MISFRAAGVVRGPWLAFQNIPHTFVGPITRHLVVSCDLIVKT